MDIESQKFMALAGIRMWARAVRTGADRLQAATVANWAAYGDPEAEHMLVFNAERHLFIIAAYKLIEHTDWAKALNFLNHAAFLPIDAMREDIKTMRDLNEHVLEYFTGPGKRPQDWVHTDASGSTDASSTSGGLLGGRVDYKELANLALELREQLPKAYWPTVEGSPNSTPVFVWSWDPLTTSPDPHR